MLIAHLEQGIKAMNRCFILAETPISWIKNNLDIIVGSHDAFHKWLLEHESIAEDMLVI